VRSRGIIEKCTFCVQRIRRAELDAAAAELTLADGEIQPACVQTCPPSALFFGDLNDPDSRVSQLARSHRSFRLLEHLGTDPAVIYLKGGETNV
jgi:molybdopterin-containing oxidoreductase family iron-sulfur binding subunit